MSTQTPSRPMSTMQLVPQLLNLDEAAALLALPGARYVRSLIDKGDLAVTKIGRYPRVRADQLAEFIERNTRDKSAEVSR